MGLSHAPRILIAVLAIFLCVQPLRAQEISVGDGGSFGGDFDDDGVNDIGLVMHANENSVTIERRTADGNGFPLLTIENLTSAEFIQLTHASDAAELLSGAVNPAIPPGVPAPAGSIFLRTDTGTAYLKTSDSPSTVWTPLSTGATGTVTSIEVVAGSPNVTVTGSPVTQEGTITISVSPESSLGTVTSVAVASGSPARLTVTGSPITSSGTITISTSPELPDGTTPDSTLRWSGSEWLSTSALRVASGEAGLVTAYGPSLEIGRGVDLGAARTGIYFGGVASPEAGRLLYESSGVGLGVLYLLDAADLYIDGGYLEALGNVDLGSDYTDDVNLNGSLDLPSGHSTPLGASGDVVASTGGSSSGNQWVTPDLDYVTDRGATTTNAVTVGNLTAANASVTANLDVGGSVSLGDADTDMISANGRVNTDFVPTATGTLDLGAEATPLGGGMYDLHEWDRLFANRACVEALGFIPGTDGPPISEIICYQNFLPPVGGTSNDMGEPSILNQRWDFYGNSLTINGNSELGDAGTDTTTIKSQVSANSSVGSSGQVLTSRGSNLSPQWTTLSVPATPDLQAVTDVGSVTTNAITVNALTATGNIVSIGTDDDGSNTYALNFGPGAAHSLEIDPTAGPTLTLNGIGEFQLGACSLISTGANGDITAGDDITATDDLFALDDLGVSDNANLGNANGDEATITGDLAVVDTEWWDFNGPAMSGYNSGFASIAANFDYQRTTVSGASATSYLPLDLGDGTVVTRLRAITRTSSMANTSVFTLTLYSRAATDTATPTDRGSGTVEPSADNTRTVTTLDIADYTTVADTAYMLAITVTTTGAANNDVYLVGLETSRREY